MTNDDGNKRRDHAALMKEALLELDSMQSELEATRRERFEPIAVVGMACRFPAGANSPGDFWRLLHGGTDAIQEIPSERWNLDAYFDPDEDAPGKVYARHAGLVDQSLVEQFSPEFFGIAPREAERMDPQQRMLLEVCWESLEDAAIAPDGLKGSQTGLYIGSCTDDYLQLFNNLKDPLCIDGYSSLGTARCIGVGRVSFVLGLEGPAIQLDTACSSSLVAIHQASAGLRNGDCTMALAGGVNLQLSPAWTVGLCKLKALSPDGRCRTFDARANGFVRGEGCGIVVLKRLSDAQEAGDRILACIRGTAVNHDGRASGLTVPNPAAQEKLLRQALRAARLKPDEVGYIEAHGTGTSLGDPVEMAALAAVFKDRSHPLWLGSVKTNIGHLEGAAGIAGLIKVILSLRHNEIPPNLHFDEPNPHIPWDELPVQVPVQPTPWRHGAHPRIAGVSSFGFSGTNAHVLVEEAPAQQVEDCAANTWHLLPLSAESPEALRDMASKYAEHFNAHDTLRWCDVCYTAAVGRSRFDHRLAIVAESLSQATLRLDAFIQGESCDGIWSGQAESNSSSERLATPRQPQSDLNSTGTIADDFLLERCSHDSDAELQKGLGTLAQWYVSGGQIDWGKLYAEQDVHKLSLPTYPFQRRRYWLPPSRAIDTPSTADSAVHPLLGKRVYSAATPDLVQFESQLEFQQPDYLADHRVGRTAIIAATAQLEMALAAAREMAADGRVAIEDISFHRAVTLPAGEKRVMQTVLKPLSSGHQFDLYGRALSAKGPPQSPEWIRHASGRTQLAGQSSSPSCLSVDEILRQCPESASAAGVYERIARQGFEYGDSFRLLRRAWRGPGQALGEAALPEGDEHESDDYWFHPTLLDACLHTIGCMSETDFSGMIVPTHVERLEVFARPGRKLWSHVRLRSKEDSGTSPSVTVDIDLIDPGGTRIASLLGLRMQQVNASDLLPGVGSKRIDWLYDVNWHPSQLDTHASPPTPTTWLLLADEQGLAVSLARRAQQQNSKCVLVYPDVEYIANVGPEDEFPQFRIRPDAPEDFVRLLEDVLALEEEAIATGTAEKSSQPSGVEGTSSSNPRVADDANAGRPKSSANLGVVHMWSLEAPCDESEAFAAAHRLSSGSTLHLVQALVNSNVHSSLWLITRGAFVMDSVPTDTMSLAQAPLWGLGQVITREHPDLRCERIDLDPSTDPEGEADTLFTELTCPDKEDQVAYRGGRRRAARLARCQPQELEKLELGESTFLITGGLGSLGLEVARWLADQGVQHLVLTSRNPVVDADQRNAIDLLRGKGVDVHVIPADVSRREEVVELLAQVHQVCPELKGVIHAAGCLDDGTLQRLNWTRFERVMRPKVAGAWHLHRLTKDLEYFVMFSSAAGLLGSPGQGNYAAANSFLDALGRYRQAIGLPALSIAWGPWQIGMTSHKDETARSRITRLGLRLSSIEEGLQALGQMMAQKSGVVAAMQVDWKRLGTALPVRPLWANQLPRVPGSTQVDGDWITRLQAAPTGSRVRKLMQLVRGEVAEVLGWDSTQRVTDAAKFFDLGMDSLTSVELQRRLETNLGMSLPRTLAFDYPSVETLSDFVAAQLLWFEEPAATGTVVSEEDASEAARLAAMSEEEIEALLQTKYKHLL